jgi:hypothetical protein
LETLILKKEEIYVAKEEFKLSLENGEYTVSVILNKGCVLKILYPKNKKRKYKIYLMGFGCIGRISKENSNFALNLIKEKSILISPEELIIKDIIE